MACSSIIVVTLKSAPSIPFMNLLIKSSSVLSQTKTKQIIPQVQQKPRVFPLLYVFSFLYSFYRPIEQPIIINITMPEVERLSTINNPNSTKDFSCPYSIN